MKKVLVSGNAQGDCLSQLSTIDFYICLSVLFDAIADFQGFCKSIIFVKPLETTFVVVFGDTIDWIDWIWQLSKQ